MSYSLLSRFCEHTEYVKCNCQGSKCGCLISQLWDLAPRPASLPSHLTGPPFPPPPLWLQLAQQQAESGRVSMGQVVGLQAQVEELTAEKEVRGQQGRGWWQGVCGDRAVCVAVWSVCCRGEEVTRGVGAVGAWSDWVASVGWGEVYRGEAEVVEGTETAPLSILTLAACLRCHPVRGTHLLKLWHFLILLAP